MRRDTVAPSLPLFARARLARGSANHRLLQPRTPLCHIRKMKKSPPSATRRSMRRGMSRRLAPVQTTRRGNVNGYLYHHPPSSLSGKIRRAHHSGFNPYSAHQPLAL
jgi:hypothetical protein